MIEETRILLVEADVLVRHALAEYLRGCGYRVAEARDAGEARVLLGRDEFPVDIVLAQGDSGFELAAWIRASHPGIQVILAGSVARATEKAGHLCEDGPVLTLPYEHKFVLEHIRRLMAANKRGKERLITATDSGS
jgi:DNA-binding response OmpR family regulator